MKNHNLQTDFFFRHTYQKRSIKQRFPFLMLMFVCAVFVMHAAACGNEAPPHTVSNEHSKKLAGNRQSDSSDSAQRLAAEREQKQMPSFDKVVFVLIDALRADKLGCYGFDLPTSPTIDKLAKESLLFEHVHSASPWTAPSFGTLFTGVSPTVHGAGKMLGKHTDAGKSVHGVTVGGIREDLPTLPQLLPDSMYKAAVINNSFVCKELGFARGFDEFDFKIARLTNYRTAETVTDIAMKWLEKNKNRSFFYFLHYFDPHIQYAPPKKYLPQFAPNKPRRIAYPFTDHSGARSGSLNLNDAEKDYIRGLYHGEVKFVDDQLARLLAYMDNLSMMDDTWIVLVSDHGEELFEHGSFEHGHRYEEEVVRVPWIIRAPGGKWQAGRRISQNVSHVDIFATILDMAQIKVPAHVEGRTVLPLVTGKQQSDRVSYMEFNLFGGQQCAIYDGQYKLIHDLRKDRAFLYDLKNDKGEHQKLDATHPAFEKLNKQLIQKWKELEQASSAKPHNTAQLSKESEDALKSLGYIK